MGTFLPHPGVLASLSSSLSVIVCRHHNRLHKTKWGSFDEKEGLTWGIQSGGSHGCSAKYFGHAQSPVLLI